MADEEAEEEEAETKSRSDSAWSMRLAALRSSAWGQISDRMERTTSRSSGKRLWYRIAFRVGEGEGAGAGVGEGEAAVAEV